MKKELASYVIIACLIFLYIDMSGRFKQEKEDRKRWQNNYEQKQDSSNAVIKLKITEYATLIDRKTDSVIRASGIKRKQITNVTHVHHNYYNNDTSIATVQPIFKNEKDSIFTYKFNDWDNCMSISGEVQVSSKEIPEVSITEKSYTNEDTYIAYEKKKKRDKWWKFWKRRDRYIDLHVSSECGESRVESIDVIRD
jgi:hypothetical protein